MIERAEERESGIRGVRADDERTTSGRRADDERTTSGRRADDERTAAEVNITYSE